MVRIFRAEAGEHDLAAIGPAVAIGVGEVEKFRAVGDVRAPQVVGQNGRGHEQPVGKHRARVGATVAIAVLEDRDRVVGDLARPNLRIDARRRDPEPPLRIEVYLQRLRDQRIGREEIHLVAVGNLHGREFRCRIRRGNILEPALGQRRLHGQGDQDRGRDANDHVSVIPVPSFAPSAPPL